ncbi:hypothetical protein EWM64_g6623 [Hericium alpestre]|uniref:Uncharacterized protein n=1 Tax=Hericium alpestre TaxID=135208 RepID=A0A4Y9ZTK9_9AGAM|nr:hypothetical protein EWM64_g6623 [Hericium alpestre]
MHTISEVSKEMTPYVVMMHQNFARHVIRQTTTLVDWEGKLLLTLIKHIFTMWLYQHKYDTLDALIEESVQTNKRRRGASKDFYLKFCRALIHPATNEDQPNVIFSANLKTYRKYPSGKLDAVVAIICHHLAKDDSPPLTYHVSEDNNNDLAKFKLAPIISEANDAHLPANLGPDTSEKSKLYIAQC